MMALERIRAVLIKVGIRTQQPGHRGNRVRIAFRSGREIYGVDPRPRRQSR